MSEKMSAEERALGYLAAARYDSKTRLGVRYKDGIKLCSCVRCVGYLAEQFRAAADEARADEREKWAKWYESRVGLSAYTAVNDSYAAQAKRLRANQGDEE